MFTSGEAEARYAAFVAVARAAVVGLDFDGTLAPIVDDPVTARIHPDAAAVLIDLADCVGAVAIVTGRPARQVVALGDLENLADQAALRGGRFQVFGQYGAERWDSEHRAIRSPRPPTGLASFERELPRLLREAEAVEAWVEDKGLAVAVHTRRMADGAGAYARLLPLVREAAGRHDLVVEPGSAVIEVRSGAADKGRVIGELVDAADASGVLFIGDDLGDVEAFLAVEEYAAHGLAGLRVAVANDELTDLTHLADVVLAGPDEVVEFLRRMVVDVRAHASDN